MKGNCQECSRRWPTMGGPSVCGLGMGLTTPHQKK
jgi:hypothetical protein